MQTRSMPGPSDEKHVQENDERFEFIRLIEEVDQMGIHLADVSPLVRESQFRVWALRWRVVADKIGKGKDTKDHLRDRSYAVLRTWMKKYPDLSFIDALNPRATGEWGEELETALQEHAEIVERESDAEEAYQALVALRKVVGEYYLPESDEEKDALFEAVSKCARHLNIRDDVAEVCEPLRDLLEREFGFLWRIRKGVSRKPRKRKNRGV